VADFSELYVDGTLSVDTDSYNVATRSGSTGTKRGYKTVNSAINAVSTGGIIYVRAGTYSELGQADTCYPVNKNMTVQAYNGEAVTLTYPTGDPPLYGGGPDYGFVIHVNNANLTLDGITVVGMQDETDQTGGYDVNVYFSGASGTIKNCTFNKAGHAAIKFGGIPRGAITIEKNIFNGCGHTYFDHHIYIPSDWDGSQVMTIRHNAFTNVAGYALHFYAAPDNIKAYGNVIHGCGTDGGEGGGIVMGGSGHRIYNNTVCNNYGIGGLLVWGDYSINNYVSNNIIRDNQTTDIAVRSDIIGVNTCSKNNKHTIDNPGSQGYDGSTDFDVDPQFAGSPLNSWDDYRLAGGSPMIGTGADVGEEYKAILDPAQTTRPTPKDQGANRELGAFTT
jgi:hypothetical protein